MNKPVSQIVQLGLTENCNLRCVYCYEGEKPRPRVVMPSDIAKNIVDHHLVPNEKYEQVIFDLIGGEPLLAWDFIKDIVKYTHTIKTSVRHHFFMNTNGTLFDNENKPWFDDHACVEISISIDGVPKAHNVNRSNSYKEVASNIPWFLDRS